MCALPLVERRRAAGAVLRAVLAAQSGGAGHVVVGHRRRLHRLQGLKGRVAPAEAEKSQTVRPRSRRRCKRVSLPSWSLDATGWKFIRGLNVCIRQGRGSLGCHSCPAPTDNCSVPFTLAALASVFVSKRAHEPRIPQHSRRIQNAASWGISSAPWAALVRCVISFRSSPHIYLFYANKERNKT